MFLVRKKLDIQADDVIFDLGCGKGRALFVFAGSKARMVVGSDRNTASIERAIENKSRFRGNAGKITVTQDDVRNLDFSEGTIFYLCNPFGIETFREVLEKLRKSLEEHPRWLRFVYYNPRFREELLAADWLRQTPVLNGMLYEIEIFAGLHR